MAQFAYKARKRTGELVQDVVEASDRAAALGQIERMGLFPVAVDLVKGGKAPRTEKVSPATSRSSELLPQLLRDLFKRKRRPKLHELATFTQQLTNLLKAGMPLAPALNSMSNLVSKGIPPEVSKQLRQDVIEGKSLSDAMAKQPHIFSDLYVNMVRAGEQSGALVEVLQRLATHYERFAEVRQKFVSALIYPAIVCCVGVVIMFFFMTVMLPKFMTIFEGMKGVQLPAATRALIAISHFLAGYWWTIPLFIVVVVVAFNRYRSTEAGRRTIDRLVLKAPIIG
ncbi:MAG: type II secretion system F family protein, partial [Verrucomicrobiae bacterium]|nr:type II secretion system F family protein [Verrucomicrobiae bacterium]